LTNPGSIAAWEELSEFRVSSEGRKDQTEGREEERTTRFELVK